MAKHFLTLDALNKLDDGIANEAFSQHLRRAAKDCLDRPNDNKARVVTLAFKIVPATKQDGTCDRVKVKVEAKSTVPTHTSAVYDMGLQQNGSLIFNEDSLDNIDQTTFLADDADAK